MKNKKGFFSSDMIVALIIAPIVIGVAAVVSNFVYTNIIRNEQNLAFLESIQNEMVIIEQTSDWEALDGEEKYLSNNISVFFDVTNSEFGTQVIQVKFSNKYKTEVFRLEKY